MTKFTPLQNDHKAYNDGFNAYMSRTKKTELTRVFVRDHLSQYIRNFFDEDELEEVDHIRMLSVGAGTGVKDIFFIDEIRKIYPDKIVQVIVVEPNQANMKNYQEIIQQQNYGKSVEFSWRMETSQEFQALSTGAQKFHLIVSLEAMYYETSVDQAIEFYMKHLSDTGVFFITIGTSECSWNRVNGILQFYTGRVMGSANIREALNAKAEKRSLVFSESVSLNRFDIDPVFEEANPEGDALTDFITHAANYRQTAGREEYEKGIELIKTCCERDAETDQLLWNMDIAMFVVRHHE